MYLQLTTRRQAERLKKLGFEVPVNDVFIYDGGRYRFPDKMDTEENWNRYDDTISRPSVALALQWLRVTLYCICEVGLVSWEKESYYGIFKLPYMKEPVTTHTASQRDRAEILLLDKIIGHLIDHFYQQSL